MKFKYFIIFKSNFGGARGIRTLDPGLSPDAPLAGVCLQPLSHCSKIEIAFYV